MNQKKQAEHDAKHLTDQIDRVAYRARFVIGIDPASRVTGLALVEIRTERVTAFARCKFTGEGPTVSRLQSMEHEIGQWIGELQLGGVGGHPVPESVVIAIEVPSPSRSTKTRDESGGYGLPTYARAVGRIESMAERVALTPESVITVNERTWTGRAKKGSRAAVIAATVPGYDPAKDRGQDIADAIGVALWIARRINAARGVLG